MARFAIRVVSWAVLFYLVLPLAVIIGSSLTASSFLAFPPQGVTFAWYGKMLGDPSYISAFVVSTILAMMATIAAIALSIPAALAIARYQFPGRQLLSAT